jgi:histidinol phosphatase-like PHP family hydrolase
MPKTIIKSIGKVPGNWYEIDFHVHSPCSADFKGPRDETGYIALLQSAEKANLDIIVIADHNDIEGYKKLLAIKNDYERTKHILEINGQEIPDAISNQLEIFHRVTILPGVELDLNPNIHLIVIFDPLSELQDIDDFITQAGFPKELRGSVTVSRYSKWGIEEACSEANKIGAIAIAAHVDSDKGLYQVSKDWGQKRISAFTDENLYGMEFNNPISKDQIRSILKTKEYSRATPLAFVQSSDFHGKEGQTIGERRTYARLERFSMEDKNPVFRDLKKALRNPDEYISAPNRPEISNILDMLLDQPSFENLMTEESKFGFLSLVCGYANTEDGTIVLGKNDRNNWIGIESDNPEVLIDEISELIKTKVTPIPSFGIETYPYYNNRIIISLRIRKQAKIFSCTTTDRVYLIDNKKPLQATTEQIVDLVENNLIDRYSHLSITHRINTLSNRLNGLGDSIDILPLIKKIDYVTLPFKEILKKPKVGDVITLERLKEIKSSGNGLIDGNIIVLSPIRPRYDDSYLRFSAPISTVPTEDSDLFRSFFGDKIIMVLGGGVFYDDSNDIKVVCTQLKPVLFQDPCTDINMKYIFGYLKTSVAIWYSHRCLGSTDIYDEGRIFSLPLPVSAPPAFQTAVINLVDEILDLEKHFLKDETQLLGEINPSDEISQDNIKIVLQQRIDKHNADAGKLVKLLDNAFFEYFRLSKEEIEILKKGVQAAGLYTFNIDCE